MLERIAYHLNPRNDMKSMENFLDKIESSKEHLFLDDVRFPILLFGNTVKNFARLGSVGGSLGAIGGAAAAYFTNPELMQEYVVYNTILGSFYSGILDAGQYAARTSISLVKRSVKKIREPYRKVN